MKRRIFFAVLLIAAAAFAGRYVSRMGGDDSVAGLASERRESYKLEPGASVEVRAINGSVEVLTAETDTAVVQVVRAGGDPDDPVQKIVVEHTPSSLVVRGEGGGGNFWRWLKSGGRAQQEVKLTLPRLVALRVTGVNGPLNVGEVEGSVEVKGCNGDVEVAQSVGHSELKGINGSVTVGVARLGEQGVEVKGVNGSVEIRLRGSLDADINVKGQNGNVVFDVPNVTTQEREGRHSLRARLGAGGPQINIRGGNGNVTFKSDVPSGVAPTIVIAPHGDVPPPPPPPKLPTN